ALELFPAFYGLIRGRQRARDYREEYAAGRMSHTARRLMDALAREHPQYTRGLRANTFMLEPSKTREFERAMAELQQGLWVVKTEERYEPTFSYRWDLVEAWLPEHVAEGRRLTRAAALDRLLERYVAGATYASPRRLARLLGVPDAWIAAAVPVVVATAVTKPMPVRVQAVGNILAAESVTVRSQVTGQLSAVHFTEGQDVKRGQLLFTIDPRPFETQLQQAQAELTRVLAA